MAAVNTIAAQRQFIDAAKGDCPACVGEQGRERNDRHDGFGADDRHQHQRHQGTRSVAGKPPDDGGQHRHEGDQCELRN